MGAIAVAINADSDDILKIMAVISHDKHAAIPVIGTAASKTPNVVATPFPPLNLSQIGKLCPIITGSPNIKRWCGFIELGKVSHPISHICSASLTMR